MVSEKERIKVLKRAIGNLNSEVNGLKNSGKKIVEENENVKKELKKSEQLLSRVEEEIK